MIKRSPCFSLRRYLINSRKIVSDVKHNHNYTRLGDLGKSLISDIMLQDVGKDDLISISEKLGVRYLESTGDSEPVFPVNGIV